MNNPAPPEAPKTELKYILLFFAWVFIISSPWIALKVLTDFTWAPSWNKGISLSGIVLIVTAFVCMILLVRRWRKGATKKSARAFAIVISILVGLTHLLGLLVMVNSRRDYEPIYQQHEIELPSGKRTFYISNESSWEFLFDGGFSVWVREENSPFVHRVSSPVWKSEYDDYEVSGDTVRFFFVDDNPFSERGSGDIFIEYVAD